MGERKGNASRLCQADIFQPYCEFTQKMAYAARPRPAADIDDPFPEHRPVDQRVPPQQVGKVGMPSHPLAEYRMGHEPELAGCRRCKAVIHHIDMEAVEIRKVAGGVEGHDLSLAVDENLVPAGEARDNDAAVARAGAFFGDEMTGPDIHDGHFQRGNRRLVLRQEIADPGQLPRQHLGTRRLVKHMHPVLSACDTKPRKLRTVTVATSSCGPFDEYYIP